MDRDNPNMKTHLKESKPTATDRSMIVSRLG